MLDQVSACVAVRAGLLTTAGLLVGTLFGSALQSWLRIDIVPIGVSADCLACKDPPICQMNSTFSQSLTVSL